MPCYDPRPEKDQADVRARLQSLTEHHHEVELELEVYRDLMQRLLDAGVVPKGSYWAGQIPSKTPDWEPPLTWEERGE